MQKRINRMFGCCNPFFSSPCRCNSCCCGRMSPAPAPIFPPVTPPPAPQLRGMQLSLEGSSGGTAAANASVPFDTVDANNTLGVSYTAGSGSVTIGRTGTYLVNWWVSIAGTQTAQSLAFAVSLNGSDVQTSYSDIGGGQVTGSAVVNVTSIPTTLQLINRSAAAVTYATAGVQAGLTLTQLA